MLLVTKDVGDATAATAAAEYGSPEAWGGFAAAAAASAAASLVTKMNKQGRKGSDVCTQDLLKVDDGGESRKQAARAGNSAPGCRTPGSVEAGACAGCATGCWEYPPSTPQSRRQEAGARFGH